MKRFIIAAVALASLLVMPFEAEAQRPYRGRVGPPVYRERRGDYYRYDRGRRYYPSRPYYRYRYNYPGRVYRYPNYYRYYRSPYYTLPYAYYNNPFDYYVTPYSSGFGLQPGYYLYYGW